jgi:hypothetical protein
MTVFYDDFYSNSLTISNAPRFRGVFLGNFFGNFFWKFFSLKTHEPTVPAYVKQKKCKKGHQFNVNNYCRGLTKGFYHCGRVQTNKHKYYLKPLWRRQSIFDFKTGVVE